MTKEQLKSYLNTRPVDVPREFLIKIFDLVGYRILDYKESQDKEGGNTQITYEVHYKRNFIIEVSYEKETRLVSFSNEFVNFTDGSDGVSLAADSFKSILLMVLEGFTPELANDYKSTIPIPRWVDTKLEAQELLETLKEILINE